MAGHHYFRIWRQSGLWATLNATLQPSAGIMDTQSVKTTGVGGERGYDGAKKSKGRKRHLLVETQGLGLACTVHAADVMDRDGVTLLLSPEETPAQFPPLAHVWLDAGYNGPGKGKDWIEKE